MTSSTSSSSRTRGLSTALALAAIASLAACRHAPPTPGLVATIPEPDPAAIAGAATLEAPAAADPAALAAKKPSKPPTPKIAVFPVQNASGGKAPIKLLTEALDSALMLRGVYVIPRADLDRVLAAHRLRFTGGVDPGMAKVLRQELGIEAVLVPTLEAYAADAPPKVALGARLVLATDRPMVLWADAVARSGDDSPGFLKRGLVGSASVLEDAVVKELSRRVASFIAKGSRGEACGGAGRFRPRHVYRARVLDDVGRRTVAVLPFVNETSRRSADDVVLGQTVAQLARSGSFDVLDPGVVREQLLRNRIVLSGGVSVDAAMALLSVLDADLVVSGRVQRYDARSGTSGAPAVELSVYVIDRQLAELVWSSGSDGTGADGVFFFDAGRVHTTSNLSCRMVRGVVDRLVGRRGFVAPPTDEKGRTANAAFYASSGAVSAQKRQRKQ